MFGLITAMFAEQEIISFDIVDRGLDRQTGPTKKYNIGICCSSV
jgi:hypothetical protein